MRITESADWREGIPFETPVLLADVVPGEPSRCVACPANVFARPRTELWAYKHRHPNNHHGYVRFYCADHVPAAVRAEQSVPPGVSARPARARAERRPAERRAPAHRPTAASDVVRAMCPDCFIEVSAMGICGNCGRHVA